MVVYCCRFLEFVSSVVYEFLLLDGFPFCTLQVTEWLRTEGDSYLDSHFSFGDNASETEELIEMHSRFEKSFKVDVYTYFMLQALGGILPRLAKAALCLLR